MELFYTWARGGLVGPHGPKDPKGPAGLDGAPGGGHYRVFFWAFLFCFSESPDTLQ